MRVQKLIVFSLHKCCSYTNSILQTTWNYLWRRGRIVTQWGLSSHLSYRGIPLHFFHNPFFKSFLVSSYPSYLVHYPHLQALQKISLASHIRSMANLLHAMWCNRSGPIGITGCPGDWSFLWGIIADYTFNICSTSLAPSADLYVYSPSISSHFSSGIGSFYH